MNGWNRCGDKVKPNCIYQNQQYPDAGKSTYS
jgi:hypothetical protein